ncbi:MAG: serine/threonine-protein phosphatase [Spirochaetes bacterium]|nr:serine/threonine-protein phosphatase [Spirochaetota bacterium]
MKIYKAIDKYFYFSLSSLGAAIFILFELLLSNDYSDSTILILHKLKMVGALICSSSTLLTIYTAYLKRNKIVNFYLYFSFAYLFIIPFDIFTSYPITHLQINAYFMTFDYRFAKTNLAYTIYSFGYIMIFLFTIYRSIFHEKNLKNRVASLIFSLVGIVGGINDFSVAHKIYQFPMIIEFLFFIYVLYMFMDFIQEDNNNFNMLKTYSTMLENIVRERTLELEIERNKLQSRNQIMEHEIILARKIQKKLIPDTTPVPFISSVYKPMEQLGGDFYNFISFKDSDNIGIFLSDVSGHGVPAAFITSMIKTIILQAGDLIYDPASLLYHMNEVLQSQTAGNFVTAFCGIYDPCEKSFLYANAGHNQPYIITDKDVKQLQGGKNTAIAMFSNNMLARANKKFENHMEFFQAGSKLLLYTDGLVEARPVDDDTLFEYAHMGQVFIDNHGLPCDKFLDKLMEELVAYRKADTFDDDICLICMDII